MGVSSINEATVEVVQSVLEITKVGVLNIVGTCKAVD